MHKTPELWVVAVLCSPADPAPCRDARGVCPPGAGKELVLLPSSSDEKFIFATCASPCRPGVITMQALSEEERRLWMEAMDGREPVSSTGDENQQGLWGALSSPGQAVPCQPEQELHPWGSSCLLPRESFNPSVKYLR